ncbi:MAG: hypothetical protein KAH23_08930 [Kiritimatiellae bacterium]|nr:hypothetical protein [Kiritimatiellia bacterium]
MPRISFKDWTKPAIVRFHKQHGSSLSEHGVTPLQILVAVLDHTPGFRDLPEVQKSQWGYIFKRLSSLYDTTGRKGIRPEHSSIMQAAIEFEKIPAPADSEISLDYLFVVLRENAVKLAADEYELKEVEEPSFADFGISFPSLGRK